MGTQSAEAQSVRAQSMGRKVWGNKVAKPVVTTSAITISSKTEKDLHHLNTIAKTYANQHYLNASSANRPALLKHLAGLIDPHTFIIIIIIIIIYWSN